MENFEKISYEAEVGNPGSGERHFQALKENKESEILNQFSEEQRKEIKHRQKILSSLAYFIGKDFQIPVELNEPGGGWHWDFKENKIRIDPRDLLEKPMDYLRFVTAHEGGHRRISRAEFIAPEEWNQPGFSFMMNAIEDPRDNNFVAESYPKFNEQMSMAYQQDLDFEAKAKDKAREKLGYQPRFMQAGFEYIKQWFKEIKGEENKISEDLPQEVKKAVEKTLGSAQDSWWRYPSKQEADKSEKTISKYAQVSYEINRDEIWPEFRKLVEEDMKDQKMQEFLKDLQKGKGKGAPAESEGEADDKGFPNSFKDKLTNEEKKDLEEAIEKAIEETEKRQKEKAKANGEEQDETGAKKEESPVGLDSLPEDLKKKIKDYIDSLPKEKQKELADKAQKAIEDFEKGINEELGGKLFDNPAKREEREKAGEVKKESREPLPKKTREKSELSEAEKKELEKYKELAEKALKKDANIYEEKRREVLSLIDKLERDLREIFVKRKAEKWQSGFKSGKKINLKKRIQEEARQVPAMESKAWQKRELPQEKDYAISLLIDLSGSMRGEKIEETFKSIIVLAEALNRLSIKIEIIGFNDRLYEYQKYGDSMSQKIREAMGGMLKEVGDTGDTGKARWNDDGWALEQVSQRLARQKAQEKFLLVLSDGSPVESPTHPRSEYELGGVIKKVRRETDQKLIGLGIGPGTDHVAEYYPTSLANVPTEEMVEKLSRLIREAIANYDKF